MEDRQQRGVSADQTEQEATGDLAEMILPSGEGTAWGGGEWAQVTARSLPLHPSSDHRAAPGCRERKVLAGNL